MAALKRLTPIETTCAQIIAAGYAALALSAWHLTIPSISAWHLAPAVDPWRSGWHLPAAAAAAAEPWRSGWHLVVAYLAGAFTTWSLVSWQLWSHRAEAGDGVLGPATAVTLLRAWLVSVVGGHVLLPPAAGGAATLVALTYTTAAILDNVDGRVARRTEHTSALGAHLDVRADALGLLVAPLVAVRAGRLPPWYLLLAIAFPLMRAALRWRQWRGLPVYRERLKPNPRARLFAGVQMGVVATALYPVLPAWLLWPAATLAMVPTLWLFIGEWRTATRE